MFARTLTIGRRTGTYPGMPATRTFNVVIVKTGAPVPFEGAAAAGRAVKYTGAEVKATF